MGKDATISFRNRLTNAVARTVLSGAMLVPYEARVRVVGWIFSQIFAPVAGWRTRIRKNLDHVLPDLSVAEREKIVRRVPNNVGRTLIEIYSGEQFISRIIDTPLTGPGVAALEAAKASDRPLVLLTAHIGNYDAVRGSLSRQGLEMAALYKEMTNAAFNEHYVKAISVIATPVFPTNSKGIPGLVRHLREGGTIGIVADVGSHKSPVLQFFGQPARTPLSAAEWALKFNADVIPVYGLRKDDGLSFELFVDEPIPHGTPEEMMQRYNDSVEAVARDNLDQWFWIHRRWKGT